MKQLLISFLSLVIVLTTPTFGQVDSVTDQYMGNGNLLVNPGLESGLKSWTNVAGVLSVESSVVIKGKRAGKVVLSSQALNLYQDVTSYQAQLADGVQGLASIRVKTSVSGLRVCPRQAGLINSNLCVSVVANNKWGLYKVPFSLGDTSNGISINSNGTSVSGTVYFDDSFMGPQELSLETNACNSVSCETIFSADISSGNVVSKENLDWISSSSGSGTVTVTFNTGVFSVAPNCVASIGDATGPGMSASVNSTSTTAVVVSLLDYNGNAQPDEFTLVCQRQGADFIAAKNLSNGNTYSSTNADTDWASCTPTGYNGITISSAEFQCKRNGSDLLIKGKMTASASSSAEMRVNLPLWNGVQLVNAGSNIIPSIQIAGLGGRNDSPSGTSVLIEPSVSYLTFGQYADGTRAALVKQNGNIIMTTGTVVSFNARIPISGWQTSNLIIAQLSGLEKCENTLSCTDTFSARVNSAGVVSSENVDFINGNCTAGSGIQTCTFNPAIFTVAPNCTATTILSTNTATIQITSLTNTGVAFITRESNTGTPLARDMHFICQKQGVDFVSKTAKAVASDQNLRSPGITNSVLCSAKISNTGVITDQQGGCFSSCTNVTTPVCTFTTNYWASTPNCWVNSTGGGFNGDVSVTTTSMSGIIYSTSFAAFNAPRNYVCHGIKQ